MQGSSVSVVPPGEAIPAELAPFFAAEPYGLRATEKRPLFTAALEHLTELHRACCSPYRRITDALGGAPASGSSLAEFPFLPVRLFKSLELSSVRQPEVFKELRSSGTGGQPSKVILDRPTAQLLRRALVAIGASFLGPRRLPMLVIDAPFTAGQKRELTAREAGTLGFANLGRDLTFALDEKLLPDPSRIHSFLERHSREPFLVFGFTHLVWTFFRDSRFAMEKGILIHGGGWKSLLDNAVSAAQFKRDILARSGIQRVHNYYGLAEQTGSVFMECERGFFHTANFSDILIRRADLSLADRHETGMIQLFSLLPRSYPGHILLTEDLGAIAGEDDCGCGRKGTYFTVAGRIPSAEPRGCSDVAAKGRSP